MKKLFFFSIILGISFFSVFSQEINLSFTPAVDTMKIDSIQVINLSSNVSWTVQGNKTINLKDITTGTSEIKNNQENYMVYPNPFHDYANLQFTTSREETIKLLMINGTGEPVVSFSQHLLPGSHQFLITVKSPGIYFITILSGSKKICHKLLSISPNKKDEIKYAGTTAEAAVAKSVNLSQSEQTILFKFYSGNNITFITDSPEESKTYKVEFYECKDADDQHYPIVQIGSQWWMAKNLAYLPSVSPPSSVSNTEKHLYVYGYNSSDVSMAKSTDNYKTYGVLYNWPAVMNGSGSSNANPGGIRGICPEGWHLPSHVEWTQLEDYLIDNGYNYDETSDNKVAKSLAATTYWEISTIPGDVGTDLSLNNKSGFSALPGGYRYNFAAFDGLGYIVCWWSCTENYPEIAWCRVMTCYYAKTLKETYHKEKGLSVRCVKD